MRQIQLTLCSYLLVGLFSLPALAQEANHFQQGVAAFKANNYEAALGHFNRAQASGNQSDNLAYNRAVTLYRLSRLEEAREAFEALAENEEWGDLARYNLGLIAQQQQDDRTAQYWYAEVAREADNPKLKTLAKQKLITLVAKGEPEPSAGRPKALLLSVGLGRDSNVASLADELAARSDGQADTYWEGLGFGQVYLAGQKNAGTKLYGLAYTRQFQDYDLYNANILGGGLAREAALGAGTGELGARYTHTRVDGEVLADQLLFSGEWRRPLGSGQFSAQAQTSYFNAGEAYRYIEGWQHQLEVALRWVNNSVTLTPKLQWQTNDRENRTTETIRTSYSPTRLSAIADLTWQVSPDWTLSTGVALIQSEYDGQNRMTDLGGIARETRRENDERQWHLGARYGFTARWSLVGKYQYTDSDDTFDRYDHDKQVMTLKLEYALQ